MDSLIEAAKQVPGLTIIAVLVVKFLKHLEKRDKMLDTISGTCHAVQTKSMEVISAINEKSIAAVNENS